LQIILPQWQEPSHLKPSAHHPTASFKQDLGQNNQSLQEGRCLISPFLQPLKEVWQVEKQRVFLQNLPVHVLWWPEDPVKGTNQVTPCPNDCRVQELSLTEDRRMGAASWGWRSSTFSGRRFRNIK
jgi:hypothetical protein